MSILIDTSVLVAAIVATERHHEICAKLVEGQDIVLYSHGITETFSALTGGRRAFRIPAALATSILKDDYLPEMNIVSLTPNEMLRVMVECETRGVRGGAIFDYLHLVAARKAKAGTLCTLNLTHLRAFYRDGDPDIVHPA